MLKRTASSALGALRRLSSDSSRLFSTTGSAYPIIDHTFDAIVVGAGKYHTPGQPAVPRCGQRREVVSQVGTRILTHPKTLTPPSHFLCDYYLQVAPAFAQQWVCPKGASTLRKQCSPAMALSRREAGH